MASDGREGNRPSQRPTISADGRYVVFWSEAANLVPGDTNGVQDIFLHDRDTGTTERVSVASDGEEANGNSFNFSISAGGRYVAFESLAANLVPGDTNLMADVFVRDRETGTTERVSVANDGTQGNSHSIAPSVSADGRHVAFISTASNFASGDGNAAYDVFVRDREAGTTERVSVASDGTRGSTHSFFPSISADGRHVAFYGGSPNLVPGDENGAYDVFVRDLEAGTTERVSVTSDGGEVRSTPGLAQGPAISADGRHVAFWSTFPSLVPGDTNGTWDVFVHDRDTGTTERVSVGSGGTQGNGVSRTPSISADGRFVAFHSFAANLVPGITNGESDVFVRDRGPAVGVGALEVQQAPDELVVSGLATFSGATLASGEDPVDDGGAAAHDIGAEITGASVIHRPEQEDLVVRVRVASLSQGRGIGVHVGSEAGAPGTVYGFGFEIEGIGYEVRALRTGATADPPGPDPSFALYRCQPTCTELGPLSGGLGTTGEEVRVSVPGDALVAEGGDRLTDMRAFTAVGESATGGLVVLDELSLPDATVLAHSVALGIAPAGTSQESVAFDTDASLADGSFSGTLDVSSLPGGDYLVWAKACLGDTCEASSAPVALAGP